MFVFKLVHFRSSPQLVLVVVVVVVVVVVDSTSPFTGPFVVDTSPPAGAFDAVDLPPQLVVYDKKVE
jgi:hypothetical protein